MTPPGRVSDLLARAFVEACEAELAAPKPGNVHVFAPGHRMTVEDFRRSAAVAAPAIARVGAPVGERVRDAMAATMAAVGCNTNLGILLLSAPIAVAFEHCGGTPVRVEALRSALSAVLSATTVADADAVFEAIRLANPGGLGRAGTHDVAEPPTVTLTVAMGAAADRDRIARQYVTTFADVFEIGLPAWRTGKLTHTDPAFATLATYFAYAGELPDTHVARKHGAAVAAAVQAEFAEHRDLVDPDQLEALLDFDRRLKQRGVNPGTSADLTVATEFLGRIVAST